MTARHLLRLIAIDAALASREGLHVGEMAAKFAVGPKTIRRDLDVLAELSPITCRQVRADNRVGRSWRHWYDDRRRRIFRGGDRGSGR